MKILPTREAFLDLSKNFARIPVVGEKSVPHFNPSRFFRSLYENAPDSFLFESGKGPEATARYTMMGRGNSRTLKAEQGRIFISHNGTREVQTGSPLTLLDRLDFEIGRAPFDYATPFWGGWVGFFGYETAQFLDAVDLRPKDGLPFPLLQFFQVDRLWVYDHSTGMLKMIVSESGPADPGNCYEEVIEEIRNAWQIAEACLDASTAPDSPVPSAHSRSQSGPLRSNISESEYLAIVERAKSYIEEGDVYQVNLAQRFEMEFSGDGLDLYQNLRQLNPAPFSGYLKLGDLTLVSSSPERLVKVDRGILETRPIAGTRPRGRDPREDDRLAQELLLNEKEKAEHLMLVDLERNDLGRICEFGSVRVTDQMFVEQYSHVNHIVSNICGKLRPGVSLREILKAVFPGGTITGCPKIRCMEIIDELEPVARGPYSGSFGYIGFAGTLDLNIIIRTILLKDNMAYFHVGAGIVADSLPAAEYRETLDKAAAMIHVLTQPQES